MCNDKSMKKRIFYQTYFFVLHTLIARRRRIHLSLSRTVALYHQHAASAAHHPRPPGTVQPYPKPKTEMAAKMATKPTTRLLYQTASMRSLAVRCKKRNAEWNGMWNGIWNALVYHKQVNYRYVAMPINYPVLPQEGGRF